MDTTGVRDWVFGAGGLILLWRQNRILAEQNRIMRQQGPSATGLPTPVALLWRRYWPLLAMAVLTLINLSVPFVRDSLSKNSSLTSEGLFLSWGGDTCAAVLNTHDLITYQEKYRMALICGIVDPRIDQQEDSRITISSLFTISGGSVTIAANDSKQMRDAIQTEVTAMAQNAPKDTDSGVRWTRWLRLALLPSGSDVSNVHRLSDVMRNGGIVLNQGAVVATISPIPKDMPTTTR